MRASPKKNKQKDLARYVAHVLGNRAQFEGKTVREFGEALRAVFPDANVHAQFSTLIAEACDIKLQTRKNMQSMQEPSDDARRLAVLVYKLAVAVEQRIGAAVLSHDDRLYLDSLSDDFTLSAAKSA